MRPDPTIQRYSRSRWEHRERRARERRLNALFAGVAFWTFILALGGVIHLVLKYGWPFHPMIFILAPVAVLIGWLFYEYPIERRKH